MRVGIMSSDKLRINKRPEAARDTGFREYVFRGVLLGVFLSCGDDGEEMGRFFDS